MVGDVLAVRWWTRCVWVFKSEGKGPRRGLHSRIGSTTTAATGLWKFFIRSSVTSRHRASSAAFSLVCSSRGYFSFGNGAEGQSKAGMSNLWMGLLRVVDKLPKRRPWNPPEKDRME